MVGFYISACQLNGEYIGAKNTPLIVETYQIGTERTRYLEPKSITSILGDVSPFFS
jgi:hypothetical protein